MENIVNKAKQAISNRDGTAATTTPGSRPIGTRETHSAPHPDTTTGGTYGPHRSDMANRADPTVDSGRDHHHRGNSVGGTDLGGMGSTHTAGSTNYGPHDSNIANKADPRVDSGTYGNTGTYGTTGYGTGTTSHRPHESRAMNELDPHVDSDRGGRAGLGSTAHGTHGATGVGPTNTHGNTGIGSATHGTHGTHGTTGVSTGTHGTMPGGAGPHQAPILNKVDPRVDSDRDHRASHASAYSGPAPNTAGPHKSDLMNKLDPRVDSNLDGSKTVGADKTHAPGSGTGVAGGTHQGIAR